MKTFLVFGCYYYYPSGGLDDLVFQTDDMTEVIDHDGRWDQYNEVTMLDTQSGIVYKLDEMSKTWKEEGLLKSKTDGIYLKDN